MIGDDNDSFVRNMIDDEIPDDVMKKVTGSTPNIPNLTPAEKSLASFVDYAVKDHEAENYILFLVGHGMVVGNDTFLPDDNPPSGIRPLQLDKDSAPVPAGMLQLLALNSCSMSTSRWLTN